MSESDGAPRVNRAERRRQEKAARTAGVLWSGNADGTCIACYTATDTALGYSGTAEGHAAFLVSVGVPMEEA